MKRILILLSMACASLTFSAQTQSVATNKQVVATNYLAGAVTTNNGFVEFKEIIAASGKSKAELFNAIKTFTQKEIIESENHLPNTRITEMNPEEGVIAASVVETLWFKRKAWTSDFAEMHYQLVFIVEDGRVEATMRNIKYGYEPMKIHGQDNLLRAEEWITDKEALSKDGKKLTKVAGKKFRTKTIDRKNQIFEAVAKACAQ